MDKPIRKYNRIAQYSYSQNGAYFITICTRDRQRILSNISVGTPLPGCPQPQNPGRTGHPGTGVPTVELLWHGAIADKYIQQMKAFYDDPSVDQYVIMPDHIHLLISIHNGDDTPEKRTSRIARFIGTFQRFCNKEYGENIWQGRFHDHVIRNQQDYDETWEYIANNPRKWAITRHILE